MTKQQMIWLSVARNYNLISSTLAGWLPGQDKNYNNIMIRVANRSIYHRFYTHVALTLHCVCSSTFD